MSSSTPLPARLNLPLHLQRAQLLPQAPNSCHSSAVADWLPDFGGISWVAYGAGDLLVIAHMPSPRRNSDELPEHSSPLFRQAIELLPPTPSAAVGPVTDVSWCPVLPSNGELAAAAANSVCLFVPGPAGKRSGGFFCWKQTTTIVENFMVKAVAWTGSGDGLVLVGTCVVMWAHHNTNWEVAWRFNQGVPQDIVSTTWFMEGPTATVGLPVVSAGESLSSCSEENSCVMVYVNHARSGLTTFKLRHPQPACAIQWRPVNMGQSEDLSYSRREVLMTYCLDGIVRLWSENDRDALTKLRRGSQSSRDSRSFHVVATLDLRNPLEGTMMADICIQWAVDAGGTISAVGDKYKLFESDSQGNQTGLCDWLVSIGPGFLVNFWSVHCLDDIYPPRYPRINLWKKHQETKGGTSISKNSCNIIKVLSSRIDLSLPPTEYSFVYLTNDNTFIWSKIYVRYSNTPNSLSHNSGEESLPELSSAKIDQDGHGSSVRQFLVHPNCSNGVLAVSLECSGLLLFWSVDNFSSFSWNLHAQVHPMWNLVGKINLNDDSRAVEYSCLCWAPSVVDYKRFLLLTAEHGIDCFIIELQGVGKNISYKKIVTIPYRGIGDGKGLPDYIFASSLASNCGSSFISNDFILLCVWRKSCQALSSRVVLHIESSCGSSCPDFAGGPTSTSVGGRSIGLFGGILYSVSIHSDSVLSFSGDGDQVTSVSATPPDGAPLDLQRNAYFEGGMFSYYLVTGSSSGKLNLWKMIHERSAMQLDAGSCRWELAGLFGAHEGPVDAISISHCGLKIASVSSDIKSAVSYLHIWEVLPTTDCGSILLEDVILLHGLLVCVYWLSLGNGQLLLGVCLPNKLQIFSQRRPNLEEKSKEMHIWECIATAHSNYEIKDFMWGPKASSILVHDKHISVFSPLASDFVNHDIPNSFNIYRPSNEQREAPYTVCHIDFTFRSFGEFNHTCRENDDCSKSQTINGCGIELYDLVGVAEKLGGPLPECHPKAVMQYLNAGNWRRALVAMQHLTEVTNFDISKGSVTYCRCCKQLLDIPGIPLSDYFSGVVPINPSYQSVLWGEDDSRDLLQSSSHFDSHTEVNNALNSSEKSRMCDFKQALDRNFNIDKIYEIDKTELMAIAELLDDISNASHYIYERLDEPGRRFWVDVQFQRFLRKRRCGNSDTLKEIFVDSVSVAWAFQSNCQDDLLNSVLPSEPTWMEMRNLGVALWYANSAQLKIKMEKLARMQYLKKKDPRDCALLYIALNRIQVLAGLFKISREEKDKALFAFLTRNFEDDKNKGAALKNAYVLMGKHQFELAVAFFLLGGDPSSAITVCAKNFGDEQLALVICRLVEGYEGPLERNLISNVLLPAALGKGDYWLSSLLEWKLGNYFQTVKTLYDATVTSVMDSSATLCNHVLYVDPIISQFCAFVCTRSSFKNAVGEALSTNICKLSNALTMGALSRCGFPLEAMERLSSAIKVDNKLHSTVNVGDQSALFGFLGFSSGYVANLLSASEITYNHELLMASKYMSRLINYHLQCLQYDLTQENTSHGNCNGARIRESRHQIKTAASILEKKFSMEFADIAQMMFTYFCNSGTPLLSFFLLWPGKSAEDRENYSDAEDKLAPKASLVLEANKEICCFVARYVVSCYFTDSLLYAMYDKSDADAHKRNEHGYYFSTLRSLLQTSRLILTCYCGEFVANDVNGLLSLHLSEYFIQFAFSLLMKDVRRTITVFSPVLEATVNRQSSHETAVQELLRAVNEKMKESPYVFEGCFHNNLLLKKKGKSEDLDSSISHNENDQLTLTNGEKWLFIGVCSWVHLLNFVKHYFQEGYFDKYKTGIDLIDQVIYLEGRITIESSRFVSFSMLRLLASFVRQRLMKNMHVSDPFWFEHIFSEPGRLISMHDEHSSTSYYVNGILKSSNADEVSLFNFLLEVSLCPQDIFIGFANEEVSCFPSKSTDLLRLWKDLPEDTLSEQQILPWDANSEVKSKVSSGNHGLGLGVIDSVPEAPYVDSREKLTNVNSEDGYFRIPRDIYRLNGELLEAICSNAINKHQVAIASNRKGLLFSNWGSKKDDEQLSNYLWSKSDWPRNGWAGCESTPVATYVSPGIGLGSRSGAHLGLGGATVGIASLAKPGRDLTGGGAFGIPGYAGMGASGLGWGEQEDFEIVDPPATVENIHSRALSHHPSQDLLLVGSINTHVYLWKFGMDRALATYGILPAANVPPPYALASICAVQFDHYGHRFATAALDGTICTWQLEVGGRSNIHPTESSLCFSSHASDVAYVAARGSIVAAAGYSSNGANVVLWDTLVPPTTCQTSLICHEGGARSLSVLENVVGSGSIAPLIVTGGKGGDVSLHDFRFNATARSRRHKSRNQGADGMIWHIPKAHLGSVTTISAIPNTNLFLTGSKDGDVKLWDAKRCQLVFQWQKLHDRHTFFQPNSRGFGGVVRAAVTDIQVLPEGFLTCGGDGSVKLIQLR